MRQKLANKLLPRAATRRLSRDVTSQEEVTSRFDEFASSGPIHILVNNAGVSYIGSLENTTEADFERIFQVNVKGFYNCMYASAARMRANGGGVILNMASITGSSGLSDRFAYSMSKGAVIATTYSVAKAGVAQALEILRADVERTLRLLGCASIAALDRSYVSVPPNWGAS